MIDPAEKFWDRMAERYSKRAISDVAAYERKLQVTREYLRPEMEVFEFGCGTGSSAIAHAPYVRHVRAIDVSSNMIEIARRKADAGKVGNVSFERSTLAEFRVPDQRFDAVLGLNVLHLLADRDEAIARVRAMLRPGGVFVTSTVCLGDSLKFLKVIAPIARFLGLIPLVKVFSSRELEDSLTAAGFEIVHQWQPGKHAALFIVARKAG